MKTPKRRKASHRNAIPITTPPQRKANISLPRSLRDELSAWLLREKFVHNRKPSPFMFFNSVMAGGWSRKPGKKLAKHVPTKETMACVGCNSAAYAFILPCVANNYSTWGHFVRDIVDGNWERVDATGGRV